MKRIIIKIVVCICVFFLTVIVSSDIYNKSNEEMTAKMAQATLPLVHMNELGISYNTLHGLKQEMNGSFFRDTITPLGDGRTLSFKIDKYGNKIDKIMFQVRSIDGTRLVESTQINNYKEDENQIRATITIKDLIEADREYNWILLLNIGGETVRYYTRIIYAGNYNTYEKLAFVKDFHQKTFDKEKAQDLVSYLESNSNGDNTTLSYVDIHCSLSQVTWGNLNIKEIIEPRIIVQEIESQTASIRVNTRVSTMAGKKKCIYNVSEYFRVRYTPDRMYLLDYERTMNQIFNSESDIYSANKIMLGIRNSDVQMMESDGGSNLAFVNENQLFCYHAADKKMACLFSFYDENDLRSVYDNHEIKILNVDETGNVSFIVYGYMNRGRHEGSMGVQVCEYNGMLNTIEELIFIPYNKSFAALKADVDQLSYINKNQIFYLYLDGSILEINLMQNIYNEVVGGLQQGSFQVSLSNKMLVWQNSSESYNCTKLILMNLNTGNSQEIKALGTNRMLPLGFINEDLIYGLANYEDIAIDFSGSVIFPMYLVKIQNEEGTVLKSYHQEDVYVTGARVEDNLITLSRVQKQDEGIYNEINDDQIVNNIVEETGYNSSEIVSTENYQKIVQLVLKNTIEDKKLKHTKPLEIMFEGSRELDIEIAEPIDRYYVYCKDGIAGTYTHEADAVKQAYSLNGTVVDETGEYIWKKSGRSIRNQIMAITGRKSDEKSSDLAVCLETILEFAGSVKNVQELLDKEYTITQILEENLNDVKALELRGVSLDAILYYVNKDIPVLIALEDGSAMLVVGFNELNVVVMDPKKGEVYKIGMNDATKLFSDNGNAFVTYLKIVN